MGSKFFSRVLFLCLVTASFSIPAKAQSNHIIYTGLDVLQGDDAISQRFRVLSRYRFSRQFSAGLGTGFTYYNDPLSLLPVFVDLKYKLMRTNLTPFIFLETGYNISILTDTNTRVDNHRGGWMLNPGIGLQFTPKNGFGWHLNIGYNTDRSQFERQDWMNRSIKTEITYKRLMAGFGLSFSL